ncbi:MAG TPA: hypothetical protein VFA26_05740 [Gemmataceae bacterium]|nr:hypothetical protein [Gemmataceae bacterium]
MATKIRIVLCALALAGPAGLMLRAAEPAAPPAKGRVLVLDNERTLEGDIERVGQQYRIRRATGGETWVPGEKALRLCASRADAYAFLRTRANLNDPDERVRLARWCLQQQLREQALAEAQAAVRLRPEHPEARHLLACLQRAAARPAPATPAGPPAPDAEPAHPPFDVSAEALSAFATRVQPILMNTCASCHATGKANGFKLTRVYENTLVNRRAVQHNLAEVLAQVRPDQPQASPLLAKALTAHDGVTAQAPLKGRQAAAYRILEDWVQAAVATSPALQGRAALAPPAAAPSAGAGPDAAPPKPDGPPPAAPAAPAGGTSFAEPAAGAAPAAKPPPPPAAPESEFDPEIFNRQFHAQPPPSAAPNEMK